VEGPEGSRLCLCRRWEDSCPMHVEDPPRILEDLDDVFAVPDVKIEETVTKSGSRLHLEILLFPSKIFRKCLLSQI
jgi:hypothetical protein